MPTQTFLALAAFAAVAVCGCSSLRADLPDLQVTADDTVITKSCRVVIPEGTVITDAKGDGVIQIGAPDISSSSPPARSCAARPRTSAPTSTRATASA